MKDTEADVTDREFDLKLRHIEEQYAARRATSREADDAYRDQELARLFQACGWTQERIAQRMAKTRQWVSYRLTFGRFLTFATTGCESPPDSLSTLTERRFRELWGQTGGSGRRKGRAAQAEEEGRFRRVLELLRTLEGQPARRPHHKGIRQAILDHCADGDWRKFRQVREAVAEHCGDVSSKQVSDALGRLHAAPPPDLAVEVKHIGTTHQYRLTRIPKAMQEVSPQRLVKFSGAVEPVLKEMRALCRAGETELRFAMGNGRLRQLTHRLEQAVRQLLGEAAAV